MGLPIGNFLSFQNPFRKPENFNHSPSYGSKREGASRAHPRHAFTFRAITRAVVRIFQFSQRILKAEKISNLEAALRFEIAPLQSGLKRVCNISRCDIHYIVRSACLKFNLSRRNLYNPNVFLPETLYMTQK